jgi:hypothetical protein
MIFCVVTRGGKHIRRHIWLLVGLTSVGSYHSRRLLCALTFVSYGMNRRKLVINFREQVLGRRKLRCVGGQSGIKFHEPSQADGS